MVTGKNVRYVAMITTEDVLADSEDDHRGEGHDRDGLAGDHVRHERPLEQLRVDEDRRQDEPEDRPETNPIAASRQV